MPVFRKRIWQTWFVIPFLESFFLNCPCVWIIPQFCLHKARDVKFTLPSLPTFLSACFPLPRHQWQWFLMSQVRREWFREFSFLFFSRFIFLGENTGKWFICVPLDLSPHGYLYKPALVMSLPVKWPNTMGDMVKSGWFYPKQGHVLWLFSL